MPEQRLVEALAPLRRSYNQAQRLVVLGLLKGRRDDAGRWWVDTNDLERFIATEDSGHQGARVA